MSLWHGSVGSETSWAPPTCVVRSTLLARPGYSQATASEYLDTAPVLESKVRLLAHMIKASQNFAVYTGAGISTAAGIGDYASVGSGSIVKREGNSNRLLLQPTLSHRVLASLHHAGPLKHWLQQNHDGLAQKAGFPADALNEIHGSWFDRHNPVVFMDGSLGKPQLESLHQWSEQADLVLAIGTSLCGMTSDMLAISAAERERAASAGLGLVIVNLQQTPLDGKATLRIFAKSDTVLELLRKEMRLKVDRETYSAYPVPRRRSATVPPKREVKRK